MTNEVETLVLKAAASAVHADLSVITKESLQRGTGMLWLHKKVRK